MEGVASTSGLARAPNGGTGATWWIRGCLKNREPLHVRVPPISKTCPMANYHVIKTFMTPSPCYQITVILIVFLGGCTHTRTLNPASPETRTAVNAHAEGRSVVLRLHSGERLQARNVQVAPVVTTWIDPSTGEVQSVSTSDLAAIRFTNRGRGVLEGVGLGLAIGAGVGVGLGAIGGATDDEGSLISFTPLEGALLGSVLYGGLGLVIGALAGLDQGSRTVYVLPPSEHEQ